MRPDFDGRLHDLLHDAAREIPSDATVVPDLLQHLASEEHRTRSFTMRPIQRFIAPAIATMLVVALVVTFVAIHGAHAGDHVAITSTATPVVTPGPSANFTPSQITQNGITLQLDKVEATAMGIVVTSHFIQPTPPSGDVDEPDNPVIVDDANTVHYPISGTDYTYPEGAHGPAYGTQSFAPLASGPVSMHTVHFIVAGVYTTPAKDGALPPLVKGTYDFTIHLVPAVSGTQKIQAGSQTVGGITITPQNISWITNSDPKKSGAVVRLAISGLPKVADPVHHPLYFNETWGFCAMNPPIHPLPRYVFLSKGAQQQCADFFIPTSRPFDATQALERINFAGSINSDGTAVVDVGFNTISLAAGDRLQLLLKQVNVYSGNSTAQQFTGPWSFTFTLGN